MKKSYLCISANTRKKLYIVIKAMSLLATLLSLLYLAVVLYSLQRHRFLLHILIISLFDDLYKNLICLGALMFLLNAMCFKLNQNMKKQPTNPSLPRTHRMWVGLLLLTLVANAVCVSLMQEVVAVVDAEIGPRLKHGLSRYMDTPSWGSAIDRIQGYLHCCGVHGPTDWYTNAWIPLDMLTGQNVDYKLVQPTGRVQVPLVPTSCCRVVSAECGLKAWLETKTRSWADIKPADVSVLHTAGCEEAVRATVARDMLVFRVLLIIVFVLQVVLVVAARYYHTSSLNCVMLGRPQGSAPGWLLGPRLFRGKKRYGYLQDYDDRCQNINVVIPQEDDGSHKSKFKCLNKMKKMKCFKSEIGTDSEGTQSPVGGRSRSRSPCLDKLKQSKCMSKLKQSCAKRLKKKKPKEEYIPLQSMSPMETDTDVNKEAEGVKTSDSDVNERRKSKRESRKSGRISPERMRTGADFRSRHRSPAISGVSTTKEISGNLIDLEVEFKQPPRNIGDSEPHKADAKQPSPTSTLVEQKSMSKSPTSDVRRISNVSELKKRVSVVVEDFKRRREMFENIGKTEADKRETRISMSPPVPQSMNLIDLDSIESAKSLSLGGPSGSDITETTHVKNETKPRKIALRNYPLIATSGSDITETSHVKHETKPRQIVLRNYPSLPVSE